MTKYRFTMIAGSTYLAIGLLGLMLRYELAESFGFKVIFVSIMSGAFVLMGLISLLFIYLQGGFTRDESVTNETYTDTNLNKKFERLRTELRDAIKELNKTSLDTEEAKELLEQKIDSLTNDVLFEQIRNKYESRLVEDIRSRALEEELLVVKKRIAVETARISRNGNINLLIGLATTFIAISILLFSLLGGGSTYGEYESFLYYFLPRLSLSIFIELFSFFFLRIYKKNLEDIKYFNNERTNIDLKLVALRTALLYEDKESLKEVISELSKTERNFVLRKGDTTVEIERSKIEMESENSWKEIVKEAVKMGK
ncbi:MAG: hypothetical protein NXI10_10415 [bacterium]|nr:hypothetical protein [bacterium]